MNQLTTALFSCAFTAAPYAEITHRPNRIGQGFDEGVRGVQFFSTNRNRASRGRIDTVPTRSAVAPETILDPCVAELMELGDPNSELGDAAERPTSATLQWATKFLVISASIGVVPARISAAGDGGVACCFVNGDRFADIEALNTGTILAVLSDRKGNPRVWEVKPTLSDVTDTIQIIREFINT